MNRTEGTGTNQIEIVPSSIRCYAARTSLAVRDVRLNRRFGATWILKVS